MNRLAATVTSKGQITIPQEIRRRLGLHEGDRVEFVIEGERTLICRHRQEANPFARYIGALPAFRGKDDINAWVADLRDGESTVE
jgi:AbrB family looped-hinge helix DNA binding protein